MGEHPGEKVGRVVGFQPRRLVGGQRERGGVRLAETERGEGFQDPPDPFDQRFGVALTPGGGEEPALHLGLPDAIAQGPAGFIALSKGAAGHHRDDLDDLFVEHHHPAGVAQHRFEVGVRVAHLGPAVPRLQEGRDHVGFHRTGAEQRDVDDDVEEGAGTELADEFPLPWRLDLEAAQGVAVGDDVVDLRIVERGERVDVGAVIFDADDLFEGVRHRGLHPNAQHVELEQSHVFDVVLVELAHRVAAEAGLDGGAVEQRGVRQQHPARVQRKVAGQPVQGFDEFEQDVEAAAAQAGAA